MVHDAWGDLNMLNAHESGSFQASEVPCTDKIKYSAVCGQDLSFHNPDYHRPKVHIELGTGDLNNFSTSW